ncbi:hypothetical protein FDW96_23970 [Citrobacter sp. TBCS-15]|uniref:hypothetical protein n=1 Tax=Citrobacter sp. TBCS-15 TaxID=2576407 RepID=UPI0010C97B8F|nr:hypothetical protein [Citrobacter sp. TBCS-15]TKT94599.1 hypothetical protein FDW96_23970 [Citrobacter sp. TBCS-15]
MSKNEGLTMNQLAEINAQHVTTIAALEDKCAALAAELSQAKSVVSECREYFIAGIMNRMRPTNEGYLHMRCDTMGDETPSHDAFLAEVRAQGVEMFAIQQRQIATEQEQAGDYEFSRHCSISADEACEFAEELREGKCCEVQS